MPLAGVSIELPASYLFVVRETEATTDDPDVSGSPLVALGDRYPEYASLLADFARFVATGAWELSAIDTSPEAMASGPPIVQVWSWKFYNGESAAELAEILVQGRQDESHVVDVSVDEVTLPAADAIRTRYIAPGGFLTDDPWFWVEYTIVVGDQAFGLAMQAPADQEERAAPLFAAIASSFTVQP